MDSSRETLVMNTFEEKSATEEFSGADILPPGLTDSLPSHQHKSLSSSLFRQDGQVTLPQETVPLLPPSPSKPPPDLAIPPADSHLLPLNVESCLRMKRSDPLKTSNLIEVADFGLGSSMLNYLNPPQIGTTKFKRGPGRPRKDCIGLNKSPRPPSQKVKSFLGGVRGRKKSDISTSLSMFSTSQSSTGDVSIGESPPRGTDDTAESDTSSVASSLEKLQDDFSMFPELWPGKVCGFCNLGERSMLGQGDLIRLENPEAFDPVVLSKTLVPKSRTARDNAVDKCQKLELFSRRQKGSGKMKRLISQSSLESLNEPVDEVCGHSEEPEFSSIFDPGSGFYYVHYNCALWCDGVEKQSDGSFSNLELEILRALSQRCHHCGNLGAGLTCKAEACTVLLHFPCAAVSGAFQDPSNQTTVCSSHVDALYATGEISGICTVCDSRSDVTSLIMCSSCGRHYHGACMALNSETGNFNIRAGWQCPACKICQACRQPGEEGKLLACDTCDKTYHIFCLRPALSSIPKHSWKCKLCRVCTDCGARTPGSGPSSRWHANFSVCDSCYQQRNKGLACPMCRRAYRHVAQKIMLQCNLCKKFVHGTCDPAAVLATYQQRKELYPDYEYICIPCKTSGTGLNILGGNPKVLQLLKRSEESEDGIQQNSCAVSQDSLLSIEDDSFQGAENNTDLLWFDKSLGIASLEDSKPQLAPQTHYISNKEKHFLSAEKLQRRKFISGKLKDGEKFGSTSTHSIGRKTKLNEFAKKRGPKPKLRLFGSGRGNINRNSTDVYSKDEEPGIENRMVLCSARDDYVLQQDVCVMCGAFGSDLEGRLISCSQCGQCYHPYCVNVKVTKVILLKGWRCLDCTVCEGCGQRNDEARLILCDECDVSFHIYCIDPPLEQVPHGTWKCKWCAVCHYCGSNDSRLGGWFENYTKCGSCASQSQCPVCSANYNENDLIIKCLKCERWLHGACDMIKSIKDAEKCADGHYVCNLCRPLDTLPLHLRLPQKIILPKRELPVLRSPDGLPKSNNHVLVDGIYLSEYGVHQIKSLTMDLPRKKRKKMPNISDMEAGILAAIESVVSGGDENASMKDPNKLDGSEKDKDSKKRQRNLQKLGIGGFLVRLRGPRFKDEDADTFDITASLIEGDKPKRRPQKRKTKNKLVETFPTYLQEAFFGKPLMNPTKDFDPSFIRETEPDVISIKAENTIKLSKEMEKEMESLKFKKSTDLAFMTNQNPDKVTGELSKDLKTPLVPCSSIETMPDVLNMPNDLLDHDLVNTIMNETTSIKTEGENLPGSQRLGQMPLQNTCVEDNNHKDELTDFLSAQFNLDSMDSGLPSMDSKDVEDIFKGVLVEESQESLFHAAAGVQAQPAPRPRLPLPTTPGPTATPIIPSPAGQPPSQGSPSVARSTSLQQNLASPVSFPPPSPYHSEYSNSPQFSPAFSEPPSPWPAAVEDSDQPSSYNQRSILKWEADEGLGHSATISAVLYANINHPELKRDYASWAERSKQIAKIWRGLPAEKRAPYLQKARENRAASRMHKAQQDQDKIVTVNQKSRVETQEERHWKQMQALRQQQSQIQEAQAKDININSAGHQQVTFPQGPNTGILRPPRPVGPQQDLAIGSENIRQPLHINTPHEQKMSPLQSPQVPLQQAPIRTVSTDMAPPGQISNPMFSPSGVPQGQMLRSPVYSRPQFISSKPQLPTSDNYGSVQSMEEAGRSNCFSDPGTTSSPDGSYNQKSGEASDMVSSNNVPPTQPGQETRQHLRDLLQRQQVKKLEQDQMSTTSIDQQSTQRIWSSHEDWQKSGAVEGSHIRHHIVGSVPGANMQHMNQFRQPYLPPHPRMPPSAPQNVQPMHRPGEFRINVPQSHNNNQASVMRTRMMLSQHRAILNASSPQNFQTAPSSQYQAIRNSIDPYGHLVVQQQRMQGGGIVSSPSMLAQQLGRPLHSIGKRSPGNSPPAPAVSAPSPLQPQVTTHSLAQQMSSSSLAEPGLASHMSSDHQELPDSVTAELEKLEQEQHNDSNTDVETSELADLGMDDDELLGMGADFNILEYADPELDEVVGGEKTNILDNLDLEEEDKDENKDKRKEASDRGVKKENIEFQVPANPVKQSKSAESVDSSSGMLSLPNSNYPHVSGTIETGQSGPCPPQPPPPYPGPPPPYPGRPQIGIRNGCGLNTALQAVTAPSGGMKNHVSGFMAGGRPSFSHISPSSSMLSNSNHHLSLQQRKTLLLQEQPLLLEDLLEQEKREQQRQNSGLIGAAPEEPLLSDFDFERLKADVLSSSTVSLSPPNVVGMMRTQPASMQEWQIDNQMSLRPSELHVEPHAVPPHQVPPGSLAMANISRLPPHLPPPANPPDHPTTEQERQMQIQYEQWLYGQQQILAVHLKCFETEINKLRKTKKSLNSKLRQLRKNNNELNEIDDAELKRIAKELPGLQKQLDQIRKQSRQHNLLIQDYRNKQQKRQQMMGMSPGGQSGGPPTQASPLGAASSPLHSTPQSPLMSPSPSMQPSPLMQHSPMASPLTPSPGPVSNLSQTSPRGVMNPGMHMMDDGQFSPNPDGSIRIMGGQTPGGGRIHQMSHLRMATAGSPGHPIMISQANINPGNPSGIIMSRGMNPNMMQMQQQQHRSHMDGQMPRMRSVGPQDHMRMSSQMTQRFGRGMVMNQEMMRPRPPTNFGNQSPMGMSPTGHYNVSRVPFPSQSPTGSGNLRSPSPMTPMGNLGSPPNPMLMSQNRVSPASSPMRRPSGSGSIGSPMADRPQSVENPLTPRNAGSSRPHTPSGSLGCPSVDQQHQHPHQQHMNSVDNQHYSPMDHCNIGGNIGSPASHKMHNFLPNPGEYQGQMNNDYNSTNSGGGGGGGNPHLIPFPTFSFFDGPVKLGLKGGNPFSVVTESTPANSAVVDSPNAVTNDSHMPQVSTIPANLPVTNHTGGPSPQVMANASGESSSVLNDSNKTVTVIDQNQGCSDIVKCSSSLLNSQVKIEPTPLVCVNEHAPSVNNHTTDTTESLSDIPVENVETDVKMNEIISPHSSSPPDLVAASPNVLKIQNSDHELVQMNAQFMDPLNKIEVTKQNHSADSVHQEKTPLNDVENHLSRTMLDDLKSIETNQNPPIIERMSIASLLDAPTIPVTSAPSNLPFATSSSKVAQDSIITVVKNSSSISIQEPSCALNNLSETQTEETKNHVENNTSSLTTTTDPTSVSASDATQGPIMPNLYTQHQEAMSPTGNNSLSLLVGESQNALLKQLLQNTGCASTAQMSENVGFSLTSCLQTKPANPILHTSHLSEAATRIPQPAPHQAVRSTKPDNANSIINIKTEVIEEPQAESSQQQQQQQPPPPPPPPIPGPSEIPQPTPQPTPPVPIPIESCDSPTMPIAVESPIRTTPSDVSIKMECNDIEIRTTEIVEITKALEMKKPDDEAKKTKRRQYQSKRKQALIKDAAAPVKKRPRKAIKPEEDFDGFIDNFMIQLRQLPPVGIVEPDLGHSYNICPIVGGGDYSKLSNRGYDIRFGELTGKFGHCVLKTSNDYYITKPFGKATAFPVETPSPSHRGFYNQEFAAPRTSHLGPKLFSESRTPTPLRETDTPDTIVNSSSPECTFRESPEMFPCLKLLETDDDKKQHLRDSPVIQIACPIPVRPLLAAKLAKRAKEGDKENNTVKNNGRSRSYGFLRENGNITVTLTLSSAAMDEVRVVLRNLANILSIETPNCQIEKVYPPPDRKMFTFKTKDSTDTIDLQCILNGSAKFCKQCDVLVVNNLIKKNASDLSGLNSTTFDPSEELYFCSGNCLVLFSMNHGVSVKPDESSTIKMLNEVKSEIKNRRLLNEDIGSGLMKNLLKSSLRKEASPNDLKATGASRSLNAECKLEPQVSPEKKCWKNIRYKLYSPTTLVPNKYKKPTEKELTEMLFRLGITVMPNKVPEDVRKCALCHLVGDGISDGPGRLINFDVDKWIHLNCALWSEEVYETENGALVNVEVAVKQSLTVACTICKQDGASVKCFKLRCTSVYHVGCAVKDGCAFYKNKSVFCPAHIPKGEKENELTSLSVFRRVYVQRDENRQVAVVMHHGDQHHLLRVGSLIFLNVGQLLPHQLQTFHTRHYIYPVGYKIVRFYWSMTKANKRCQYICSIHEADGKPEFRIAAQEESGNEHVVKSNTAQGAWLQVLDAVSKVRNAQDCIKVFPKYITGEDLFGLTEPAIVKVLESLPGIETLTDYNFKYGRNPLLELPLAINPSGCARSEPKLRTHFKRSHTQRTGAFRASLPSSVLSSSETACPYSKQFVHSKSSQYKKMKQEWRNNVYLARSKIQGLGLYAARDIERHTMVIEYIGEMIRNELAELREKRYETQNRGIYMFRIDDDRVIDATLCGGLARYINHSCNPNCVAETVEVERDLRIIIFANRRISRGEELAYDYKFEVEDDQHKIPCLCGAPNCQQWMN